MSIYAPYCEQGNNIAAQARERYEELIAEAEPEAGVPEAAIRASLAALNQFAVGLPADLRHAARPAEWMARSMLECGRHPHDWIASYVHAVSRLAMEAGE